MQTGRSARWGEGETANFLDRRDELAWLRAEVLTGRVTTVVGPPGVGKTSLAARLVAVVADEFASGVWAADLAALRNTDPVDAVVLAATGLRDTGVGSAEDQLVAQLAERRGLLVLDGCDYVRPQLARLLARIITECPQVSVLTTCRTSLDVSGERLLSLGPLGNEQAVELFVERISGTGRAHATRPEEADLPSVEQLVSQVGGNPLALELAAGAAGQLSTGAAALASGAPSLRDLLDLHYRDFADHERAVWLTSSVFRGSFDVPALEHVAGLPADSVAEAVKVLTERAVLVPVTEGLNPRFRLQVAVQEYAAERLADRGDGLVVEERHRRYYCDLAAQCAREMYGPDEVELFSALRQEDGNLQAALQRCARNPEHAGDGLLTVGLLQHYWIMAGRFGEATRWLAAFPTQGVAPVARIAGREVAGRLAVLRGDLEEAAALLDSARTEAVAEGEETWAAHALHGLALTAIFWGDPASAVPLLDLALELHRAGDDPFGAPLSLIQLATVHGTLGNTDVAFGHAAECIGAGEAVGETWCVGMARWTVALMLWRQGRVADAGAEAREVIRLKRPYADRLGMAMSMELVAWTEATSGDRRTAARLMGAVEAAMHSVGSSLFHHLLEDHFREVDRLRRALGRKVYDDCFAEGRSLGLDAAIDLALDGTAGGP